MVLGWPIGATLAARNVTRLGLRGTMRIGAVMLPLGGLAFLLLGEGSSPLLAGAGSLVMGLGMGFVSNAGILIIQTTAAREERGAATASNIFSRNLGSTLGAAALGAVLNLSLARAGVGPDQIRHLLDHQAPAAGDALVRGALAQSLHLTFWAILAVAVATLVMALVVPRVSLAGKT
jgi:predicted MFS family arabinose efflux permease